MDSEISEPDGTKQSRVFKYQSIFICIR